MSNHCHICKKECELTLCKDCYVPLFTPIKNHESFAFLDDILDEADSESLKDSVVLDFFKSALVNAEISNFAHLRQLRLSHCEELTKIDLKDLPSLISLDAFYCKNLVEASFSNVPNLIALDLSLCKKLAKIDGEFPKLEYFQISNTKISNLPSLPSVKFIDISSTKIKDIKVLYNCSNLQRLIILENNMIKSIKIGKLAQNPSFTSLITGYKVIDFNECPSNHNLKNVYSFGPFKNIENVDFSHINIESCTEIEPSLNFKYPLCSGDWYESYRYLYGPYPAPPNDCIPVLTEEELSSITNIYPLPPNIDPKRAAYHIMGTIFGTSIGDCLGLYCEGYTKDHINTFIDHPPEITWTHPITTVRGAYFHRGSFTDDTALMLMFIRSVVHTALENVNKPSLSSKSDDDISTIFDPNDAGRRIRHWIKKGIDEHLDGQGIGRGEYTDKIVKLPDYEKKSIEVSKEYWIDTGMVGAGSGGVMRTGGCGCFLFWDEKKVIEISRQFCQCTHYNPLCVFSSVLISLIISRLIQLRCGIRESFNLDETIEEVKEMFKAKEDEKDNIDKIEDFTDIDPFLYSQNVDKIIEDNKKKTLNTLGCGIYVLRMNLSYEKGIEEVIRAGGDTDTNAACAGAVLGAKYGFGAIPLHLLNYMWYGGMLYRDTIPFLKTMGMKFDPPTYEEIKQFEY